MHIKYLYVTAVWLLKAISQKRKKEEEQRGKKSERIKNANEIFDIMTETNNKYRVEKSSYLFNR